MPRAPTVSSRSASDLIYGLPRQTLAGFGTTLDKVIAANPDRLSIYNYAHMPTVFKPQRRIPRRGFARTAGELDILSLAVNKADQRGLCVYRHGPLRQAGRRTRRWHSARAGCTATFRVTRPTPIGDLVALGVSAIGKIGPTYSQNYPANWKTITTRLDGMSCPSCAAWN